MFQIKPQIAQMNADIIQKAPFEHYLPIICVYLRNPWLKNGASFKLIFGGGIEIVLKLLSYICGQFFATMEVIWRTPHKRPWLRQAQSFIAGISLPSRASNKIA